MLWRLGVLGVLEGREAKRKSTLRFVLRGKAFQPAAPAKREALHDVEDVM